MVVLRIVQSVASASRMVRDSTHPVWYLSSGMVHPGRVCNEIKFCSASWTPCAMRLFQYNKIKRDRCATSMISISPPVGQGPFCVRVQKAGQVPHPWGICSRSRTMTDSSKARLELILMLSLPRDSGLTMFLESGNMKNLSLVANHTRQRVIYEVPAT